MPTFHVLLALSAAHCLNDLLQSVITAVYPMLKADLGLNFAQIGLVTLVYQLAASIFQPVVGYAFDRRPFVRSLPAGMCSTSIGIVLFAFSSTLPGILLAVFMVGVGSATLHPEASRITSLAGHERRGFAQSVFQVGGNFGGSVGPLLVALIVAPRGRQYVVVFLLFACACFAVMRPICRWYRSYLERMKHETRTAVHHRLPLSRRRTLFAIAVIVVLIFSKYIYMASLSSYYTFYLIDKFGVTVSQSQIFLFIFVVSTAAGTLVGGPVGDSGLTGRKIIVDTYGGYSRHGGGAFSGKDPTKVDRSAAYAARWIAKNIVAAGLARKCEVQLAYAIGVAHPVSVMVDTFGTGKYPDETILSAVKKVFDLRPGAIIDALGLRRPIYRRLAAYGHMGREDLGAPWENTNRTEELLAAVEK